MLAGEKKPSYLLLLGLKRKKKLIILLIFFGLLRGELQSHRVTMPIAGNETGLRKMVKARISSSEEMNSQSLKEKKPHSVLKWFSTTCSYATNKSIQLSITVVFVRTQRFRTVFLLLVIKCLKCLGIILFPLLFMKDLVSTVQCVLPAKS